MAFGAGTAAGSFGQFLFPPIGNVLIESARLAAGPVSSSRRACSSSCPCRWRSPPRPGRTDHHGEARAPAPNQSIAQALSRGLPPPLLRAPGARLLHLRLPARLHHRAPAGLPQGCRPVGLRRRLDARGDRARQRRRLARLRLALDPHVEALAPGLDLSRPRARHRRVRPRPRDSPAPASCSASAIGLLWLSTVPPTSSLVMLMFGTRYMAMLYGFAFFSHQVGGFLGVLLGGAALRGLRQLHARLVALGRAGPRLGRDQPADRGAAGRAAPGPAAGGVARERGTALPTGEGQG